MNMMELKEFECSNDANAVPKLIGSFFGDNRAYLEFKASQTVDFQTEHGLSPLDAEIMALHKLSLGRNSNGFDDRNFTIEVQSEDELLLNPQSVLAVIAPIVYFDDNNFLDHVEKKWGATAISYDLQPLNPNYHYAVTYDKIKSFLSANGYL